MINVLTPYSEIPAYGRQAHSEINIDDKLSYGHPHQSYTQVPLYHKSFPFS